MPPRRPVPDRVRRDLVDRDHEIIGPLRRQACAAPARGASTVLQMGARKPGAGEASMPEIGTTEHPPERDATASRAFSTCRGDGSRLMTCNCLSRSAGIDAEQFEEPGLEWRWSGDLGRAGSAGGDGTQAG